MLIQSQKTIEISESSKLGEAAAGAIDENLFEDEDLDELDEEFDNLEVWRVDYW